MFLYGLALAYESCREEYFWNDKNLKIIICDAIGYIIKNLFFEWPVTVGVITRDVFNGFTFTGS